MPLLTYILSSVVASIVYYMSRRTSPTKDGGIEEESFVAPNPVIIYYDYIDDAVSTCQDLEILLYRIPDYGPTSMYMMRSMSDDNLLQIAIPIHIKRSSDRIHIQCNINHYEWYQDDGTLVGPDNKILFHFRNKPRFISC